jgi:succinate dehydrogenase / fumarate reductase, cytochrome b subunit
MPEGFPALPQCEKQLDSLRHLHVRKRQYLAEQEMGLLMASKVKSNRPLSPHLQVYRLIPTMAASIAHRITGVALYGGTVLVAWWLIAAAIGPDYFDFVQTFLGTWFGRLVLFGFTWALMHHMLGGIRHLIWDTGSLFDKDTSTKLAYATLAGSIVLTLLIWVAGYSVR